MKTRSLHRLRSDRSGATAVEFAAVALPLLMIGFGVMEFGRALWVEQALAHVASATARCAGLGLPSCAVSGAYSTTATAAFAQTVGQKWLLPIAANNVTVTTATSCSGMSGSSAFVQVSVSYNFTSALATLIPALATKSLTGQACFPVGTL